MSRILLEVCVDDAAGIAAAAAGGADRIELCAALALGGLTPSAGLIALAAAGPVPAMAMIRPRAGDFVWSAAEVRAQLAEIASIRAAGLAGVVIGASLPDGRLDVAVLRRLVDAAQGLQLALHRAIDLTPDVAAAMAVCAELGIDRVLSSGGASTALQGRARLQQMAAHAGGVVVMPGGGVTVENVSVLAEMLDLQEVHASCSSAVAAPENPQVLQFGFQPAGAKTTDLAKIQALRARLDQLSGARPCGCTQSR